MDWSFLEIMVIRLKLRIESLEQFYEQNDKDQLCFDKRHLSWIKMNKKKKKN